jgi:two-component system, LytTR family, response regulator
MNISTVPSILKDIIQIFPEEASIAVADGSKYIYYQPSRIIDLKIKPGDSIKEGSLTLQALKVGQKISQFVESNIFGVPYYGMSVPIINEDGLEGCVTAIFSPFQTTASPKWPRHQFLIGKTEDRWIPIPLNQIFYIESNQGKTLLCTDQGAYLNKYSLTELEQILPVEQFIRCHRAFIVNVNAIEEIHPDFHSTFALIMKGMGKSSIPVSQKFSSQFRRFLGF